MKKMKHCKDEDEYAALWREFNKEILEEPFVPEKMTEVLHSVLPNKQGGLYKILENLDP